MKVDRKLLDEYQKRYHLYLSSMYSLRFLNTVLENNFDRLYALNIAQYHGSNNVHYKEDYWNHKKDEVSLDFFDVESLEEVSFIHHLYKTNYADSKRRSIPSNYPPLLYEKALRWALQYAGYKQTATYEKSEYFEQAILSQSLVMIIAHLEAFLFDTIRAICRVKPDVMKSKEKIVSIQKILEAGSFEEVVELLVGIYTEKFSFKGSITAGVKVFREQPFNFSLEYPREKVTLLDKAKAVRHIIVHNGGRVDKKYLDTVSDDGLEIGQDFILEEQWVGEIWEAASGLATQVFFDVVEKYFKEDPRTKVYWEDKSVWNDEEWGQFLELHRAGWDSGDTMLEDNMILGIQTYYDDIGISSIRFSCPHYSDCSAGYENFTTAKAAFVSTGYEKHTLPRLLILSADSGSGKRKPEDRTLAAVREQEEELRDVSALDKNSHWYCTHELAHSILREFKPDLRLPEDVQHYFAHTNSAKCCQNKLNRAQADDHVFDNCKPYIPKEIEILSPEIIVTQGQKAKDVIDGVFTKLQEHIGKHQGMGNISKIWTIEIKGEPVLWIQTYHPNQRLGLYRPQRNEMVLKGEYGKIAKEFIRDRSAGIRKPITKIKEKVDMYDQLIQMSGQKCYTLSIDQEADMYVDESKITIVYPSGTSIYIPREMVDEAINTLRLKGMLTVSDVHEKVTKRHRTRTDKLMAVLRNLPGVTYNKRPRVLFYKP